MAARRAGPAAFPAAEARPRDFMSLRSGPIVKAGARADPDRSSARPRETRWRRAEKNKKPRVRFRARGLPFLKLS
jgi:hypothetical protein